MRDGAWFVPGEGIPPVAKALAGVLVSLHLSAGGATFITSLVTNLPSAAGPAFSSDPSPGVVLGSYFYFAASDGPSGTTGLELWRTDGTTNGTTLVKDIRPGAADSSPGQFTVAGATLFFVADDGTHGPQLWRSDGTGAGTTMVGLFSTSGYGPQELTAVGSEVAFFADGKLYLSDGTSNGTVVLAGTSGLVTPEYASDFVPAGTKVVFDTYESGGSNAIWSSDGTLAGSALLQGFALTNGEGISLLTTVGTKLYFYHSVYYDSFDYFDDLYRTDLTPGSPKQYVTSQYDGYGGSTSFSGFCVINGHLCFEETDVDQYGFGTCSLNVIDPASESTLTSPSYSFFSLAGAVGNYGYYDSGPRLIRTDGTTNGTSVAVDFSALGLNAGPVTGAGARLLVDCARTNGIAHQFVGTDFTPAGAEVVMADPGGTGMLLGSLGTNALFAVTDPVYGNEPFRSDGTTNGTALVKDIAAGQDSPPPSEAVTLGGTLFMSLNAGGYGQELWASDGTPAGTRLVKDIRPGPLGSGPTNLVAWNGAVYFAANDGTNGMELWRSDGTAAGTYLVADCRVGPAGSYPSLLTAAGNLLFFVANDGAHGAELWRSDGTSNGTYMALDLVPGLDSAQITNLTAVGNEVYFTAASGSYGHELWVSDGQPGGTQFLADLSPYGSSDPNHFVAFGGLTYFINEQGTTGLWVTDDTPEGTLLVTNVPFQDLAVLRDSLFAANYTTLWKSDGTTAWSLANFTNGLGQFTVVGSNLFFLAGDDVWSTDGTNTSLAADFPLFSAPQQLTPFQGALVFTASTPPFGREIWGAVAGQSASLVEDLDPGQASPNIQFLRAATNRVFYVARPSGNPAWEVRSLQVQSLAPPPPGPFAGTPWPVPGHIESENFDLGGEGQGYHDTTLLNDGGQYRKSEGVDIESCDDTGGGYAVFETATNEWLAYTIQVAATGIYELDVRETTPAIGGAYHFEVDGQWVASDVVYNNGSPGSWYTDTIGGVGLTAGRHILRQVFDTATSAGDVGTYNWLEFTLTATNQPPVANVVAPGRGTMFATGENISLVAAVIDPTTTTAPAAEFLVDGQSVGSVPGSPYTVPWTVTSGPHVLRVTATDSFGVSATSPGVLFFGVDSPLVPEKSFWRVSAFGTNVPNAWRGTSYDDSHWPKARAPMGFGYAGVTLIPSNFNSSPIPAFYFRQWFTNDFTGMNFAALTLKRDDAAVVYLNGQELARLNLPLPPTNIVFTNLALTNVLNTATRTNPATDTITVPLSRLVNGGNLLAVEVHQGQPPVFGRDNFDAYFGLEFSALAYNPGAVLQIHKDGSNALVQWPDYLPNWQLQQSPDFVSWTNVNGSPVTAEGLSGLELPLGSRMFFRLQQPAP